MSKETVLAVDLGASSGRVMAVSFGEDSLGVSELHRFNNPQIDVRGTLYWDVLGLWRDILVGIRKGKLEKPASLALDTWGVDFALLDRQGNLLSNPLCYRNATEAIMPWVAAHISEADVFAVTGIQFMPINTLYQLAELVKNDSPLMGGAETFLMMPDLFNYWLTGEKVCEYTDASTTQFLDARRKAWATPLLEAIGAPIGMLPKIVMPGTELGTFEGIKVLTCGSHDTASAVVAVPCESENMAYISSGTWSLVGLELDAPILNGAARQANVTNEGGVGDRVRLLKNVMGLWLLQQCRATWALAGESYSFAELISLAEAAPALGSLVPVNDGRFLAPGDHPALVRQLCAESGQKAPETPAETVRCVLESLALEYAAVLDKLKALSGKDVDTLHIVGGGSQNELLNQFTADACSLRVVAGPTEATVLGNACVQLMSLGHIKDVAEARELVAASADLKTYTPRAEATWQEARDRYNDLIGG